jgi:hypothetical protein
MSGNGGIVEQVPDPRTAAVPSILVKVGAQGLEVQSNVAQIITAVGMLEMAKLALLQQAQQGPPSRIMRVQ